MKLLTKELREKFPRLEKTGEKDPNEVEVIAKFFCPWNNWAWFATEFDGKDTFFGFVKGFENELGTFSLKELQSIKGPWELGIERDLYFGKHTLAEVMKNG